MKVTYLVEKVGPYHAFRLGAIKDQDLTILETRPNSERYSWKENITVHSLSLSNNSTYLDLWKILDKSRPEVLFISGYGFREMLWGFAWAIRFDFPIVLISDSTVGDEPQLLIKEKVKNFIISHVNSGFVAGIRSRKYLESYSIPSKLIFEPYDIIDNSYFSIRNEVSPVDFPYFLCISRFIPYKNLPFLIDSFSDYLKKSSDSTHLVILGDGPMELELRDQIDKLEMGSRIHLKGFLINSEVRAYYQSAIAMVLASISEAWGLCINEAISAGIPVLITQVAGATEDLIEEEISGFTFSPFKKEELISQLKKVRNLTSLNRQKIIEKAQEKLKWFSLENFLLGFTAAAEGGLNSFKPRRNKILRSNIVLQISKFIN